MLRTLLFCLLLLPVLQTQKKPEIMVSPSQAKSGEWIMLSGTGFTPDRFAMSHLRRPDGSEYNPLRLRIDERGDFLHKIDTVMLDIGTFEVWVEDETTQIISNRTQFEVQ